MKPAHNARLIAALSTFSDLVEHDLKEGKKGRHKEKAPDIRLRLSYSPR